MALKKSQLYSSIWQACDTLRGGMDASQYKDYVQELAERYSETLPEIEAETKTLTAKVDEHLAQMGFRI